MSIEGTTEYTSCSGLIHVSSSSWPESALFQISANGVDLDKLVIGKPGRSVDVNNGYMSPGNLAGCVSQAHDAGWGKFDFLHLMKWKFRRTFYRCWCDGLGGKSQIIIRSLKSTWVNVFFASGHIHHPSGSPPSVATPSKKSMTSFSGSLINL